LNSKEITENRTRSRQRCVWLPVFKLRHSRHLLVTVLYCPKLVATIYRFLKRSCCRRKQFIHNFS